VGEPKVSDQCPVCDSDIPKSERYRYKDHYNICYICDRCGTFDVLGAYDSFLQPTLGNDKEKIAVLSHWIRSKNEAKTPKELRRSIILLDKRVVENVLEQRRPTPTQQADLFVRWIGDHIKSGGQYIEINKSSILAIIGAIKLEEFYFIFEHLKKEGLIESKTAVGKGDTVLAKVTLSFKGLKYYQELKQGVLNSKKEIKAMRYSFKQIKLSQAERVWLTEILKSNFSKIDVKSLRVKLWKKLPKDFAPNKIDHSLVRDNRLTLIGLWHVEPNSPIFSHVSKTIEITKDLILKNTSIKSIQAIEIAHLVGMSEREAEIVLMLIYDLRDFFGSASGSSTRCGFKEAGFPQHDLAYDRFLNFESLDKTMEQFFINQAPRTNIRNRELPKGHTMSTSGTFWKKPSSREIWNDIYEDFEVKKLTFAKKINFVIDPSKRKTIFRDIEHAYILAKNDFSKPAVILAGSVIEELLRLYLKTKKVKPANNTFEEYVKACEQKKLLKSGIYSLSDSVRHFRNLVHIEREKTQKHKLSKAAAKSAVASIFIISNDFQKSNK
jgi:hypothetical protein